MQLVWKLPYNSQDQSLSMTKTPRRICVLMLNPKHAPCVRGSAASLAHGRCSRKHWLIQGNHIRHFQMPKIVRVSPKEHNPNKQQQQKTRLFLPGTKGLPGSKGGARTLQGLHASRLNRGQGHSPLDIPSSWLVHLVGLSGLFWFTFRDGITA